MEVLGMEYEFKGCTRKCAATGQDLPEGANVVAVLVSDGSGWKRLDYAESSWPGPPHGALAWWKTKVPPREGPRVKLAPNEILFQFFVQLFQEQQRPDLMYVLALLLIRRRVLRLDDDAKAGSGRLACLSNRDERSFSVPVVALTPAQAAALQDELQPLLTGAATRV